MTKKKPTRPDVAKNQTREFAAMPAVGLEASFEEVVRLIRSTQRDTLRAVNTALVNLYLRVGEYISRKLESAEWGDGVVDKLAKHIARTQPGLRGFSRQN